MKLKTVQTLINVQSWEELRRYTEIFRNDVVSLLNGNVSLTDNARTALVTVTFPGASSTQAVEHDLGFTPSGYLVAGKTAAIQVFDGTGTNDERFLYVQASGAGTARLLVF